MIQKCYSWKENKTPENKNSSKRVVVLMKYAKFFFAHSFFTLISSKKVTIGGIKKRQQK
jgi:hypothetical protein